MVSFLTLPGVESASNSLFCPCSNGPFPFLGRKKKEGLYLDRKSELISAVPSLSWPFRSPRGPWSILGWPACL